MGVMKSCKETSTLVTQSLDRKLTFRERAGMWLHLLVCRNCVRFMRQMHLIRAWLRNDEEGDTQTKLDSQTRERIARKLQEEE